EPWITCDDLLMRTRADEILQGVAIMRHLLGSSEVLVGIEDNKPEAIAAMQAAATRLDFPVEVVAVPARYPGGGAKQRLVTLTGHVLRPQNFEVLIGTPMHTLVELAGDRDGATGVLMGGPMMGVPIPSLDVPVVKATNCILVKSDELFPPLPKALPCIR